MIDLSNETVLRQYLIEKQIVQKDQNYSLTYCGGGVSGTVVFLEIEGKAIIVKQALAQLKVKETWLCDPNRMYIEMESNKIYHQVAPDNAPAVLFYDAENYIFGREAAPAGALMWKQQLLDGLLDFRVAEKTIDTLLAVHDYSSGNPEVAETFADKEIFYQLRISPYIEFIVEKYPQLKEYAAPVIEELMGSSITLIHGDFSPKNVMVDDRKVYILDFEVAHYGHPSFDLAFFSNHFILKAVKNKVWAESFLNMLRHMIGRYLSGVKYMSANELEKSYIRLLSLLMIARVDGKSPAEYITEEDDKELIRSMAFSMQEKNVTTLNETLTLIESAILSKRES